MKNIGKILTACVVVLTATVAFAGPPHEAPHHDRGNSGVRLAADIVGLVGASLDILAPRPVVVTPQPQQVVVTTQPQPVVVAQPTVQNVVYTTVPATQVVYTTPAPVVYRRTYHRAPPPPPAPRHGHGPGHGPGHGHGRR